MLVYSNGAFKSGSTWLYAIARNIRKGCPLPDGYQNPNQNAAGVLREQLEDFLTNVDYATVDYVLKAHLSTVKGRAMLEGRPNVRILTIERDIRDVAVSAYYHYLRLGKIKGTFEEYFWTGGERTVRRVLRYHRVWAPTSSSIHKTTYEALLEDFEKEISRIADFLEVTLSTADLQRVKEATSLSVSQKRERNKKGENKEIYFFRKGTAGQWTDYLTPPMLKRIEEIQAEVNQMSLADDEEAES